MAEIGAKQEARPSGEPHPEGGGLAGNSDLGVCVEEKTAGVRPKNYAGIAPIMRSAFRLRSLRSAG